MSQILGTDGVYDARGKPTIVRDPVFEGDSRRRFYIALTSALLFSNGFHLDAAWALKQPLISLIEIENSGVRRLLSKGYIRLVCRVPREDMLSQFKLSESLRDFVENLDIWNWPTSTRRPNRVPVTEDGEWLAFTRPDLESSLVEKNGRLKLSKNEERLAPVPFERAKTSPPESFWKLTKNLASPSMAAGPRNRELDEILLVTTDEKVNRSLTQTRLSSVLGSTSKDADSRIELCCSMLDELISSECGVSTESLQRIGEMATSTAELLGVALGNDCSQERIAISVRDVVGFLLCWQRRSLPRRVSRT